MTNRSLMLQKPYELLHHRVSYRGVGMPVLLSVCHKASEKTVAQQKCTRFNRIVDGLFRNMANCY